MPVTSASSIATTLGIGSGVDMAGLANQLAEAQFAPKSQRLNSKSEQLKQQISLAGSIRSALSQFASALGERVRTGDLAPQPTITNGAVASVSTPAGSIGSGSFSLEVLQLAKVQTLASPAFASATSAVGAGTLTIRFGATSQGGFTPNTERPDVAVAIPTGATLSQTAAAINAKRSGVTAYVAQTADGAQLVLKGPEGRDNGFVLEVAEDPAEPGLAALAWSPGGDPARLLSQSQNAEYKLDGLVRTSPSNTVASAAPGLNLSLTGTNAGSPATVAFTKPGTAFGSVMQDIVGALNEIAGQLSAATNPLTGELARDPGARSLARSLSGLCSKIVMPGAAEGTPRTMTELGLAIERDGQFRFDAAKLQRALDRDPEAVAAMFTNGINGVFAEFDKLSRNSSLASDPGSLGASIARYQAQSTQISVDLASLAEKQEALRSSMVARFAKADTRVSASKATLTFLQSQIDVWNAQRD